ncbi:MAG TPA: cation:proton antiporter [Rhodothermales bacterium]|nr:cation:proton antiporter [Rhodothermales bacterium]
MTESILVGLAIVLVLGTGAQWLAWRYKLPSILLLLILGFLAGPITGILDPATLQGEWVFAFVTMAVGIILFESGMSLRLADLREVGSAVRNLITIGVLVTLVLVTLSALYLLGYPFSMAIIVGSILVVTGPTVIIPLLRHVRPSNRVGRVAQWEGIIIDPIGALLAVLVLDSVLLLHETSGGVHAGTLSSAGLHALQGILLSVGTGLGVGVIGAVFLVSLLRWRLVPDFLQSAIALMTVIGVLALADSLHGEAGLFATTLMGIMIANQKYVAVRRIVEFKEDLRVLLLGSLFIILSARLNLSALQSFAHPANLLFLAVLMVVVRPVSVWLSTIGTGMNWREKTFLSWLAPRGVVAAAVASLFSFRLQEIYPREAAELVPLIFLVIVGTVAVYGFTLAPAARWLRVAQPNPQGILFVGAHPWAQKLAAVVQEHGFRVLMIDSNPANVAQARELEVPARYGNILAEGMMEELNLAGIGRLLALTPNDEVNSLACLSFTELFDSAEVYQLALRQHGGSTEDLPQHLRGRLLFGADVTFPALTDRFNEGAVVTAIQPEEATSYDDLRREFGDDVLPAFILRGTSQLQVVSEAFNFTVHPGDTVIAVASPTEDDVVVADTSETDQMA